MKIQNKTENYNIIIYGRNKIHIQAYTAKKTGECVSINMNMQHHINRPIFVSRFAYYASMCLIFRYVTILFTVLFYCNIIYLNTICWMWTSNEEKR